MGAKSGSGDPSLQSSRQQAWRCHPSTAAISQTSHPHPSSSAALPSASFAPVSSGKGKAPASSTTSTSSSSSPSAPAPVTSSHESDATALTLRALNIALYSSVGPTSAAPFAHSFSELAISSFSSPPPRLSSPSALPARDKSSAQRSSAQKRTSHDEDDDDHGDEDHGDKDDKGGVALDDEDHGDLAVRRHRVDQVARIEESGSEVRRNHRRTLIVVGVPVPLVAQGIPGAGLRRPRPVAARMVVIRSRFRADSLATPTEPPSGPPPEPPSLLRCTPWPSHS